jgi:hypothetical protein
VHVGPGCPDREVGASVRVEPPAAAHGRAEAVVAPVRKVMLPIIPKKRRGFLVNRTRKMTVKISRKRCR